MLIMSIIIARRTEYFKRKSRPEIIFYFTTGFYL